MYACACVCMRACVRSYVRACVCLCTYHLAVRGGGHAGVDDVGAAVARSAAAALALAARAAHTLRLTRPVHV